MRRIIFLCLGGLLVAGAAFGEDFWAKKDYLQWTDEEVKKLVTDSPWAKDVTISAPPAALGGGGRGGGGERGQGATAPVDVESNSGGGGRGGRGGGRTDPAADGGGPADILITLNLSWRSALPVRKALIKKRLGASTEVPADAQQLITKDQDDYVVVVSGLPARMARVVQDAAQLNKSMLKAGKKPPIAPRAFDFQTHAQTLDVIFVFPKTTPIVADDKDVEVDLKIGQLQAKKKFSLKDMIYNGKLEL